MITTETKVAETASAPVGSGFLRRLLMALGPILAALVIAGAVLLAVGVDPLEYYGTVLDRGLLSPLGIQQTLTRMAPLLFIAAGLIVAFRAGMWNLGGDGQFLLGAVIAAASAPVLVTMMPGWAALIVAFLLATVVAIVWSLTPALLRAYQGVNEIITTLMMTFLGTSLANVLVKLVFLDPKTTVPQTRTLPVEDRLPRLFDTTITSGLIFGLIAIVAVHLMMTRTAFGLKLRIVGANPRAAIHAGLNVPKLTVAVFALSAGLIGLGGRRRHPRRPGQRARRLEPCLRYGRHPGGFPRATERLCGDWLRASSCRSCRSAARARRAGSAFPAPSRSFSSPSF